MKVTRLNSPTPPPSKGAAQPTGAKPVGDQFNPGEEDLQEIQEWSTRHRKSNGIRLNPVLGEAPKDVKALHNYLGQMVERLAGDRLRQEGIHFEISLYSSEEINAYMGRIDQGRGLKPGEELEEGKKERIEEPWAVRQHLGFAQDGKPLYELGWNVGNFSKLKYEEELAFIVAHELSHLFENHLDPGQKMHRSSNHWLASQSHEAAADHQAIEMMTAAGYNVEAALSTLNHLHATSENQPDADDLVSGVYSGASSHHHEGVRIALAQGKIEMLRRQDERARPGADLTPIPTALTVAPIVDDPERTTELEALQADFKTLTLKHLAKDDPVPWLDGLKLDESHPMQPALSRMASTEPSTAEMARIVTRTIEELDKSAASPQQKVDAGLRMFRLQRKVLPYKTLEYTKKQQEKLTDFFLRNSLGDFGWKSDRYLEKLATDQHTGDGGIEFPQQNFAWYELVEKQNQAILEPLVQASPQWNKLVSKVPALLMTDASTGEQNQLEYLADLGTTLARREDTPLNRVHKKNLLAYFEKLDFKSQVERLHDFTDTMAGSMEFSRTLGKIFNPDLESNDKEFLGQLRGVLNPTIQAFSEFRDRYALETLDPQAKPEVIDNVLFDLFRGQKQVPFSEGFRDRLDPAMMSFIKRANNEPNFVHSTGFKRDPFLTNPAYVEYLGELLQSQEDPQDKAEVVRHLASSLSSASSLAKEGESAELARPMVAFLNTLPAEEIVSMVTTPARQNETELTLHLGRLYGLEDSESKKLGLDGIFAKIEDEKLRFKLSDESRTSLRMMPWILQKEADSQLSLLTLLGHNKDSSSRLAGQLTPTQTEAMLSATEKALERHERVGKLALGAGQSSLSSDGALFLMDAVLSQKSKDSADLGWLDQVDRVFKLNKTALDGRSDFRERIEARLMPTLSGLKGKALSDFLARDNTFSILKAETIADLAVGLVGSQGTPAELAERIAGMDEKLQLRGSHPEAYEIFTQQLAEKARLQPNDLEVVFPQETRSATETASVYSTEIRGLSALVGLTRGQEAKNQIHMIEYLMGRREDGPEFLSEASRNADKAVPMTEIMRSARSKLQKSEAAVRVMVVNSFLAGPSSFVRKPEGLNELLDHVLKDISEENQPMARRLAEALLDSQGSSDSLALAYVLAQKGEGPGGKLDEAAVLSKLFDAYGVPGIKFKQYLAFTSEFSQFREAFESAQDSAMPLSYLEAMKLVDKRFDGQWPEDLKIDKVLGSGSVNVAVRYFNPESGKKEVLSIARDDIEAATDYDFYRFNKFLSSLTNTPEDKKKFGYLLGLSDIIRESVDLEMDKQASARMQQSVQPLYKQKVNGWNIQSIPAYKTENMAIFMAEAQGKTARRVHKSNPELYQSAMKALSQVEMDALLGIDENHSSKPVALHANPDFHDGQVLIDEETRSVTILDFGQAVPITNEERETALDLLSVIGKAESPRSTQKILKEKTGVTQPIDSAELEQILEREDAMDTFVHLLSLISRHGGEVPISAVHWIMGIHRQMALGEKIDTPNEAMVRNLGMVRKVGGSLRTYNRLHLFKRTVDDVTRQLLSTLGFGPALPLHSTAEQK